jgi:hypothetical protein
MELRNSQMCAECVEITENGAIWHDSSRENKQQRLGRLGSRTFEHVHKNLTQCPLCALTRIALETKDGLLPAFDTTIYYSRILFTRYSRRSALSTPQFLSQDHRDEDSQIHSTYRLRAMTALLIALSIRNLWK